jgi:hypothetical protein
MTIDERIAKLAERHEALTLSVEILTKDLSELQGLVSQLAEGTARLLQFTSGVSLGWKKPILSSA